MLKQNCISIQELLNEYNNDVRPLLMEISLRAPSRSIPANIGNEIRAMNDHIARCYIDGKDQNFKESELKGAASHLKRIEYDCYKQLNVYLYDKTIALYEKYNYEKAMYWQSSRWEKFRCQYNTLKKEARDSIRKAKNCESVGDNKENVLTHYRDAYSAYHKLEDLFIKTPKRKFWTLRIVYSLDKIKGYLIFIVSTVIVTFIVYFLKELINHIL